MTVRFFTSVFLIFYLIGLASCKNDDNELMVLIQGKWGRKQWALQTFDDEEYDFTDPENSKYYKDDHGNVMVLLTDSLTIHILDSKLYIKKNDGTEYATFTIDKLTHSKLKLSRNGSTSIFHHRQY